ncbi:MAG: ABC transporter substrate-binding protein [Caldicoprobacteraceae bacterium]|jgi:multiple sugar transport system substrate-binding protein
MKRYKVLIYILTLFLLLCSCGNDAELPRRPLSDRTAEDISSQLQDTPLEEPLMEPSISRTLTITAGDIHKDYLDFRKKLFQKEYPDVDIQINYYPYPEMTDDTTYATRIATDLASGLGADLIELYSLPFHKYAMQGYFEDLYPYMDSDMELTRDCYYPNILKALETDGKLYRFVTVMNYKLYTVNKDYESILEEELRGRYSLKYEELTAMCDKVKNTLPPGMSMYPTNYYSVFTAIRMEKGAIFDLRGGLVNFGYDFLELINHIKPYAVPEFDVTYKPAPDENSLFRHSSLLLGGSFSAAEKDSAFTGSWLIEDSKGNIPFYGIMAYAINAKSDNKKLAWEFLKLLTDDVQTGGSIGYPDYLPARKDEYWTDYTERKLIFFRFNSDAYPRGQDKEFMQTIFERMDKFHQMLNYYDDEDAFFNEICFSAVKDYRLGLIDEQGLASRLQEKLTLYVNE